MAAAPRVHELFPLYSAPVLRNPWGKTLLLIGEAPGEAEEESKVPFTGPSGKLLDSMLEQAGMRREWFHCTNVFHERPKDNKLEEEWTVNGTELKKLGFSKEGRLPQLNKRFLLPQYESQVHRCLMEVSVLKPDLTICLGGKALWALTGDSKIMSGRGVLFPNPKGTGTAIATPHPAAVLRAYDMRPLVWADLVKARMFLEGTLAPPVSRTFYISPTFEEMQHVYKIFQAQPTRTIGVDIETAPGCDQITVVGFSTERLGICIPLWNKHAVADRANVYASARDESEAWKWIKRFCALPHAKVCQNGLYDTQYLLDQVDARLSGLYDDTAILQHALQPELKKDLGTLASLYLNEPAWKFLRSSTKDDNKADE